MNCLTKRRESHPPHPHIIIIQHHPRSFLFVQNRIFNKRKLLPKVFIGGRNRLFQLSPDLDIVATAITGPKNVSSDCSFPKCAPNRKLTDNVNKVLLIDYSTSRLIACGSINQGYCSVVNLQNVSIIEEEIQEAVVANNERMYYSILVFFLLFYRFKGTFFYKEFIL